MIQASRSTISILAMRKEPSHRSEMISQILFGENINLIRSEKEWCLIETEHDRYQGWIEVKSFLSFSTPDRIEKIDILCTSMIEKRVGQKKIYIPFGSFVTDDLEIDNSFCYSPSSDNIHTDVMPFFHEVMYGVPYLWGGRTVFGVDCSGLSQLYYRFFDIHLFRDAYLQATQGTKISYDKMEQGDLLFFHTEKNHISHVGIVFEKNKILHASGEVRIDTITEDGIYREDLKVLTHQFHSVRRFLI